MAGRKRRARHPAIEWGVKVGIEDYRRLSERLGVPYETFKGMVSGHRGCSLRRAETISKKSSGAISAIELLRWHEVNRRTRPEAA